MMLPDESLIVSTNSPPEVQKWTTNVVSISLYAIQTVDVLPPSKNGPPNHKIGTKLMTTHSGLKTSKKPNLFEVPNNHLAPSESEVHYK